MTSLYRQQSSVIAGVSELFGLMHGRRTGTLCQCPGIGVKSGSTSRGSGVLRSRLSSSLSSLRLLALAKCVKLTRKRWEHSLRCLTSAAS